MMIAGLAQFYIGRTLATSGMFSLHIPYSLWRFRMGGGALHAQCMIPDSLAAKPMFWLAIIVEVSAHIPSARQ
jgi:hypothetical protein